MMRRVEITTIYEKKPSSLALGYRRVLNGPTKELILRRVRQP